MRAVALVVALCVAGVAGADTIADARLTQPTDRYPHDVLGGIPGHGALQVTLTDGTVLDMVLPLARVFEDVAPRLADIDGDAVPEVVVVESDQTRGARLTAWGVARDGAGAPALTLRGAGDFIGTRFRWLAVAGIADFDGDGVAEVAYVDRPHLLQQLVIVRLAGARFVPVMRLDGVSNHRIGERVIAGGVRDCGAGAELIVPAADGGALLRVAGRDGAWTAARIGPVGTGAVPPCP